MKFGRKPLPPAEQIRLALAAQHGDRLAREQLIDTTNGFVFFIARKINRHNNIDFDDALQAGRIGLNAAIDTFDPLKGAGFTTHAAWSVRKQIQLEITNHNTNIRVPYNLAMSTLGLKRRDVVSDGSEQVRASAASAIHGVIGLSDPVRTGKNMTVGDIIADDNANTEEEYSTLERSELLRRIVREYLVRLRPRQDMVIHARFLRDNGMILEEVGAEIGITRERVRQIEAGALKELSAMAWEDPLARELLGITYLPVELRPKPFSHGQHDMVDTVNTGE